MAKQRKFKRDQKGKFSSAGVIREAKGKKLKTAGKPLPPPGLRRITKHDGSVQVKKGATLRKKKKPEKPRATSVKKILKRSGD